MLLSASMPAAETTPSGSATASAGRISQRTDGHDQPGDDLVPADGGRPRGAGGEQGAGDEQQGDEQESTQDAGWVSRPGAAALDEPPDSEPEKRQKREGEEEPGEKPIPPAPRNRGCDRHEQQPARHDDQDLAAEARGIGRDMALLVGHQQQGGEVDEEAGAAEQSRSHGDHAHDHRIDAEVPGDAAADAADDAIVAGAIKPAGGLVAGEGAGRLVRLALSIAGAVLVHAHVVLR
jgi:hypothetical protein